MITQPASLRSATGRHGPESVDDFTGTRKNTPSEIIGDYFENRRLEDAASQAVVSCFSGELADGALSLVAGGSQFLLWPVRR